MRIISLDPEKSTATVIFTYEELELLRNMVFSSPSGPDNARQTRITWCWLVSFVVPARAKRYK